MSTNTLTNNQLAPYRQISDQLADQLIVDLYNSLSKEKIGQLFRDYINDLDELSYEGMPNCLREYFANNQQLPSWYDAQKVEQVGKLFLDIVPMYSACLLCRALPVGYTAKNTVKVLTTTGYLSADVKTGTAKRLLETTQFLFNVMRKGALAQHAIGTKHILKVRFIHAMIRYHLQKHQWDNETYGIPINQEDMAGTILTFGVGAIKGLDRINVQLTEEEKDAFIHFWAVVGHLIGVLDDLNPKHYQEAEQLYEQILSHQAKASPEGKQITHALCNFIRGFLHINFLPKFPEYLIRYLIGNERYSDIIGLDVANSFKDKTIFNGSMTYLKFLNQYRKNPLVAQLIKPANRFLAVSMIEYFDSEFKLKLHIPEALEQAWELKRQRE